MLFPRNIIYLFRGILGRVLQQQSKRKTDLSYPISADSYKKPHHTRNVRAR